MGSNPTLESMEDKLDLILRNQEILNRNQLIIYREILASRRSTGSEFLLNYLADLAGTATSILGLDDILKDIKKKLS